MPVTVRNLPAMWEAWLWSLGWKDPLEKGIATLSHFLPGEFHGQRSLMGYIVHEVAKSRTRLGDEHFRFPFPNVKTELCLCLAPGCWPLKMSHHKNFTQKSHFSFLLAHQTHSFNRCFITRQIQTFYSLLGNVIVFTDLHMTENVRQLLGNKNFDLVHRATQL